MLMKNNKIKCHLSKKKEIKLIKKNKQTELKTLKVYIYSFKSQSCINFFKNELNFIKYKASAFVV